MYVYIYNVEQKFTYFDFAAWKDLYNQSFDLFNIILLHWTFTDTSLDNMSFYYTYKFYQFILIYMHE